MIPTYSPEAHGRMFSTHQTRLPKELAAQGIITMETANRYLREHDMSPFNREFTVPSVVEGTVFDQATTNVRCQA